MALFAVNPTAVRAEQPLGNYLPAGYGSIEQVDERCRQLSHSGRLCVVRKGLIDANMETIKNPRVGMRSFRELAAGILDPLMSTANRVTQDVGERKVAVSIRAGAAFLPIVLKQMPHDSIGFVTQTRIEEESEVQTRSVDDKLGPFHGKHAILVDPMLATGGSLLDMVDAVMEQGATGATTVTAFSAPQGIAAVAEHPNVHKLVTTPLEAGLNEQAFIVGGHTPHAMLGDFGDRYFGDV